MMRASKIFSVFLITLQVCTLLFADTRHTDDVFGTPGAVQTLHSQDRGAGERHKDNSPIHYCLACYRAANSAARKSSIVIIGPALSFTELLLRPLPAPRQSAHHYRSASKRGPPSLFSSESDFFHNAPKGVDHFFGSLDLLILNNEGSLR